jgi:choline dehydrogenase-like flavoprotein
MLRADFEMKTRYGGGPDFPPAMVDWPISYDDLEPWYCDAEREMGVAGSTKVDGLFDSPQQARSGSGDLAQLFGQLDAERINQSKPTALVPRKEALLRREIPRSTTAGRRARKLDCVPLCPIGAKYVSRFRGQSPSRGRRISGNSALLQT